MRAYPWMIRYALLTVGLCAVAAPPHVLAAEASAVEHFSVETRKAILDNGMTVLLTDMPGSSTVSIYALVKTGSAVEDRFLGTGITHFMEHMLFKGTPTRGVGEIPREVQALGGNINASTGLDHTVYTLTVPADRFAEGLDILSDMLMHARFDAEEIDKEREVVYSEMRLYRDRPERVLSERILSTVYQHHPYGVPVIGYEELLAGLTREDFLSYYHERYAPNNMVLSIAGKIDPEAVLGQTREAFREFARRPYYVRNLLPEPEQIAFRHYETAYKTDLTRMSMCFAGVSLTDGDMYALDVLSMVLGQGRTSPLWQDLFEKRRLVKSITASNMTPVDRGVFEVEAVMDHQDVDAVVDAVMEQIALMQKKGPAAADLEKAKRQILARYIQDNLTSEDVAYNTAVDEAVMGDPGFSRQYVTAVTRLRPEDLRQAARKYLRRERLSVVALKPQGSAPEAAAAEHAREGEIHKTVLANGVTLLLREDHRAPVAAVALVLNGGLGQESAELNGLSEFTARLWMKGTARRSADEISRLLEDRGMSAGGFSGNNSFGLRMNVLADDLPLGLDLLEDAVKNARFPQEELDKEKDRVRAEIMAREDNISAVTDRALREELFRTHPYRLEALGTPESVGRITRDAILAWYHRLVSPKNMVISVFGDFDTEAMTAELTKRFGALAGGPAVLTEASEAPPEAARERVVMMDKVQAMLMYGFQGADLKSPDYFPLEVLTAVLGSPFSGRIFHQVREQLGGAYTLGGSFTPGRGTGVIRFHVLTTEENMSRVRAKMEEILEEARSTDVPDQELAEIKAYLKGDFQMGLETPAALGFMTALDELYGRGYDFYQGYNKGIDAVTKEDLLRVAAQYLDARKAVVVESRPQAVDGAAEETAEPSNRTGDML